MPLAIACRSLSTSATSTGKSTPAARHHLPFERVAMQVDDARQYLQAAGIDAEWTMPMVRTHGGDFTPSDPQRGFVKLVAEKGPAAFDR